MRTPKPTLLQLRKQTTLDSRQLAAEAGVSLAEAYTLEIGGFVSPAVVEKVITAYNRLTGAKLSSQDIAYNAINHPMRKVSSI